MEDGLKEDPAQCKDPKFLGKAGWLKKAPGRLLASYKDRYIHVEKTEIVVYENENMQNCLERLDLENYDKCHELKSPFKKKHRLILIRSLKTGNKVQDAKFQAQTAEEKEDWIKAISDGVNRAKNKVFDEVKIDESSNLEHVTRTRPRGNRNRRPPTRIHMKEVADVSSHGVLHLDLDTEDAFMPNGTYYVSVDGTDKAIKVPMPPSIASEAAEKQSVPSAEEEAQSEQEVSTQKKVIKPPMPSTKENKSSSTADNEPDKDDAPEKKVLKPPMPPSKEAKPCASSVEEATEEVKAKNMYEKSPDDRKKTSPPPIPPNKPSSNSSLSNLAEALKPRPNSHPPTPPAKEKKPSNLAEVQGTTDENEEKEDEDKKEATEIVVETDVTEKSISKEAVFLLVTDDKPESPITGPVFEESRETISSDMNMASNNDLQISSEQFKMSSSPLFNPKKKPEKLAQPSIQHIENKTNVTQPNEEPEPNVLLQTASDTSTNSPQAEKALPKSKVSTVVVSLNDPVTDSLSLRPLLCYLPGEKKMRAEEKSVDSGQHSDNESESSGSEDTLVASTAALRGSHAGLDVLDATEDDIPISVCLRPTQALMPTPPLTCTAKVRSASIGDLLSDFSSSIQVRQHTQAVAGSGGAPSDDVMKLEAEVALEMEDTSKLLSRMSQSQGGCDGEVMPEDLLAKAMEKLKRANRVLREVKKLKSAKNSSNRKSW